MSFIVKGLFRLYVRYRLLVAYLSDRPGFKAIKDRSALRTEISISEKHGKHGYVVPVGYATKYHYVEKGEGPLMLFLHGFPQCWYTWKNQLAHFGKTHRCVALDMKGFGDSDKPFELEQYSPDLLTAEIAGVIEALGYKDQKVILVGHDWGGIVSWAFAERYPQMLDRLVILNAPHFSLLAKNMATMPSSLTTQAKKRLAYMIVFQKPELGETWLRCKDGAWLDAAYGAAKQVPDKAHPGEFRTGYMPKEDIEIQKAAFFIPGVSRASLNFYSVTEKWSTGKKGVPVRTLIVWGDDDAALDHRVCLPGVEEYFPNIEIQHIAGCSHWVPEQEPEEVNAKISEFLAKQ